jgi:hypothetical protein
MTREAGGYDTLARRFEHGIGPPLGPTLSRRVSGASRQMAAPGRPRVDRPVANQWTPQYREGMAEAETTKEPAAERFLAELLPGASPREHEIRFIRKPDPVELDAIDRADRLIAGLAGSAAYQRCLDVLEVIEQRLAEMHGDERPPTNTIQGLRGALQALAEALDRVANDLAAFVVEFKAPGADVDEFEQRIETARQSEPWRHAAAAAEPSAGSFKLDRNGNVVWQPDAGSAALVIGIVRAAVLVAQDLLLREFLVLEAEAEAAAGRLRRLTLEALEGLPALVEAEIESGGELPGTTPRITPRQLALDRIPVVLGAVRRAKRARDVEATAAEGAVSDHDGDEGGRAPSMTIPGDPPATATGSNPAANTAVESEAGPAEELVDEPSEPDAERVEAESSANAEQTASSGPPPPPADFASLFHLVRKLNEDLEHEWSRALDVATLTPAIEQQLAAVGSLLVALQRRVAVEDERLREAGLDPRIAEWPVSPGTLAALGDEPDDEEELRRLRLAQLDALAGVTEALDGMREASTVQISFGRRESAGEGLQAETVERFWDAGAFRILRARAELLERITADHDRALDRLLGEPVDQSSGRTSRRAFDHLQLAAHALAGGDPEAALVHTTCCVHEVLDLSGDNPEAGLRAAEQGSGLDDESIQILVRAFRVADGLGRGKPSPATAVLLAHDAARIAHGLVFGHLPRPTMSGRELADLIESEQPPLRPIEEGDNDER